MTRVEKGRVHVILGSFIKGTAVFIFCKGLFMLSSINQLDGDRHGVFHLGFQRSSDPGKTPLLLGIDDFLEVNLPGQNTFIMSTSLFRMEDTLQTGYKLIVLKCRRRAIRRFETNP